MFTKGSPCFTCFTSMCQPSFSPVGRSRIMPRASDQFKRVNGNDTLHTHIHIYGQDSVGLPIWTVEGNQRTCKTSPIQKPELSVFILQMP